MKAWWLDPEVLSALRFERTHDRIEVSSVPGIAPRVAGPEELVRQLVLAKLVFGLGYPPRAIELEFPVQMGRSTKRADIVVLSEFGVPSIVVEVKAVPTSDGVEQLKSYLTALGATYGAYVTQESWQAFIRAQDGSIHGFGSIPTAAVSTPPPHPLDQNYQSEPPPPREPEVGDESEAGFLRKLGIVGLRRTGEKTSIIETTDGSVSVLNTDLISFEKVRRCALRNGIVLPPIDVPRGRWAKTLRQLFAEAAQLARHRSLEDDIRDFALSLLTIQAPCWIGASQFREAFMAEVGNPLASHAAFGKAAKRHFRYRRTNTGGQYWLEPLPPE